ncbi:FAD/NAD(P)-binding domain-containing protein [Trametes gibbosa]|nr:FAD/NAD(P)-binding domain-containing protein [Trametes gibbosa]
MLAASDSREGPVAIIGAGVAGLITAQTLLQDGFADVQVLTRDLQVGGVWAANRIYQGLYLNNVHGQYRFSAFEMPPPAAGGKLRGRLSGPEVSRYFEAFADKYLKDVIKLGKDVQKIRRHPSGRGWQLDVYDVRSDRIEIREYARIVLCTGGCATPKMPESLRPTTALAAGFEGPVLHTAEFAERANELLSSCPTATRSSATDAPSIVVVGGGKSAQDVCAFLANEGRSVTMVCNQLDAFLAYPLPLPAFLRNSRFLAVIMPHIHLRTKLERFLHTTWLGNLITQSILYALTQSAFFAAGIPADSPLRNTVSPFWHVRVNDDGVPRPDAFYGLAVAGKINVITSARVSRFGEDGETVVLEDGRSLRASAVVLGTGYKSSWETLFDEDTMEALALGPQPANPDSPYRWDYTTLSDPPPTHPDTRRWSSTIYRGLVPAKNITRRDLAMNGTCLSANNGYTSEVAAHWISAYFLRDEMRIPGSVEDALEATEREASWLKQRHPQVPTALNPSYMGFLAFMGWPQYTDDLLEDMGLPILRSGGNAFTWPFRPVRSEELATLKEERDMRRGSQTSP